MQLLPAVTSLETERTAGYSDDRDRSCSQKQGRKRGRIQSPGIVHAAVQAA